MRIKVNKDRIFVILEPMKDKIEVEGPGGKKIMMDLPEKHSERSRVGVIQSCGEEVTDYFPGEKVLLSTYAGVRIHLIDREIDGQKIDEDRFRIIRAEEIQCILLD